MIQQFKDYNETQSYEDYKTLPKGGYVVKIMGVSQEQNSNGAYLKIGCDIAEGEYKDFYSEQYKRNTNENKKWGCNFLLSIPKDDGSEKDSNTKRFFKTFTEALEESNSGYHFDWDETKFKGKLIGGLFNEQEFVKNNGSIGTSTKLARVCSVQRIKDGTFKLPDDKKLTTGGNSSGSGDFMNVSGSIEEELPF